ncbi:MAG: glycosyltransferase family 2 protein [Pseudomonadota bacterium]
MSGKSDRRAQLRLVPSETRTGVHDDASPFAVKPLGEILVATGALPRDGLNRALRLQRTRRARGRLGNILVRERLLSTDALAVGLALQKGVWRVPLSLTSGDPSLIDAIGADRCIRHRILPLRHQAGVTVIAASRPEEFEAIRHGIEAIVGPVALAIADERGVEAAILAKRAQGLVKAAEARPLLPLSARQFHPRVLGFVLGALFCAILAAVVFAPVLASFIALIWSVVALTGLSGLKAAALTAELSDPARHFRAPKAKMTDRLPRISIMVPLLSEAEISGALVKRLKTIRYPTDRLEICLVVEQGDGPTTSALLRAGLPEGWRVVEVPRGTVRTKPRALNYGLDFLRGEIIGVYDAEDAPEPDQLLKVAAKFATAAPDVACLQGRLAFYNARRNWLSRCFAIDYAAWFGVVLPGLARLGFVIPLGGTTLFFRRAALEALGRWDSHNVTEDADLGLRLARIGLRTEMVDTVTREEANCRVVPWIKQRSRWIKGYALTYIVHMRRPWMLYRNLGAKKFLGVQAIFLGSVTLFLLAPFMWSLAFIPLGLPHPLSGTAGAWFAPAVAVFIGAEVVNLIVNGRAVWIARGERWLLPWVPTLMLYFPLAAVAAYRGLIGLAVSPFAWDKTRHGQSDPDEEDVALKVLPKPRRSERAASQTRG